MNLPFKDETPFGIKVFLKYKENTSVPKNSVVFLSIEERGMTLFFSRLKCSPKLKYSVFICQALEYSGFKIVQSRKYFTTKLGPNV